MPWKGLTKINTRYDVAISYTQVGLCPYFVIDKVDARKKIMWHHHGSYTEEGFQKALDERYYPLFDTFVTVGESQKEHFLQVFPALSKTITVIKNIIDTSFVEQSSDESVTLKPARHQLVTVARLSPEKGQRFALEVAAILKQRRVDFSWTFVGSGADQSNCLEKAKALKVEDVCHFVGAKANPYPYIKQCDVYVQPSFVESQGMTVFEAKILKKPIVASDIPALRLALVDGEQGVIAPLDPRAFADAIYELLNNRSRQQLLISHIVSPKEENKIIKQQIVELLT